MLSSCVYSERPLDTQIRIDNLMRMHGGKYPLSWYESLSEKDIRAMHTSLLAKWAASLVS